VVDIERRRKDAEAEPLLKEKVSFVNARKVHKIISMESTKKNTQYILNGIARITFGGESYTGGNLSIVWNCLYPVFIYIKALNRQKAELFLCIM
jgi:hypothetical protein